MRGICGRAEVLLACQECLWPSELKSKKRLLDINTLRTGDEDLGFYITTVQDG